MKQTTHGENIFETAEDFAGLSEYDIDALYAVIYHRDEAPDGDMRVGFFGDIREDSSGRTVAWVRGFPTRDEFVEFMHVSCPELLVDADYEDYC